MAIESIIQTRGGNISILDSRGEGPAVLLIHGNSLCKEVFQKQFDELGRTFRLIAMDLPGHGKSDKAKDPQKTYTIPGYAEVAEEVLDRLHIDQAAVMGWSLGGHIAIEMLKYPAIRGIFITGTPPIPLTPEGFQKGFRPCSVLHLLSQEHFTEEEAIEFITPCGIDPKTNPFVLETVLKTDGVARSRLIASMQQGVGGDQKAIVETATKPVAIVGATEDVAINYAYVQTEVRPKILWGDRLHFLQGDHAVFWQNPKTFNALLSEFLISTAEKKK